MMLIIIHHCIVHGLGLKGISDVYDCDLNLTISQMPTAFILNSLCICAVNCFILISGYFGIKVSKKKFLNLISILAFYTLFFAIIPALFEDNLRTVLRYSLFISHSPYWFIVDYLFLLFFVPMINTMFEKCEKKDIKFTLIGLLVISCYFGFIWQDLANHNGYTLLQFILMYILGRWICLCNLSLRKSISFLLYFIPAVLCGSVSFFLWKYGYSNFAWRMTYYNDPLLILSATGIFMFFKNINLHNSYISYFAKSSLAIYLVQSSPYIERRMYSLCENLNTNNTLHNGGVYG